MDKIIRESNVSIILKESYGPLSKNRNHAKTVGQTKMIITAK